MCECANERECEYNSIVIWNGNGNCKHQNK